MDNMAQLQWMARIARAMGLDLGRLMDSRIEVFLLLAAIWRRAHPI